MHSGIMNKPCCLVLLSRWVGIFVARINRWPHDCIELEVYFLKTKERVGRNEHGTQYNCSCLGSYTTCPTTIQYPRHSIQGNGWGPDIACRDIYEQPHPLHQSGSLVYTNGDRNKWNFPVALTVDSHQLSHQIVTTTLSGVINPVE